MGADLRVVLSTVLDYTAKLVHEALLFRRVAVEVAGVDPADVVIHQLETVPDTTARAVAGPCRLVRANAFSKARPHANKIVQCESGCYRGADAVALLDADMLVLARFDAEDVRPTVAGVPVFGETPATGVLAAIFERARLHLPAMLELCGADGTRYRTLHNNLNGGLYLLPIDRLDAFGAAWATSARRLIDEPAGLAGADPLYTDQLAAALAISALGLTAHHLPAGKNAPPALAIIRPVEVLHDFSKHDPARRHPDGRLRSLPAIAERRERRAVSRLIAEVDAHPLGAPFAAYKRFRAALYAHAFDAAAAEIPRVAPFERLATDMRTHLKHYRSLG